MGFPSKLAERQQRPGLAGAVGVAGRQVYEAFEQALTLGLLLGRGEQLPEGHHRPRIIRTDKLSYQHEFTSNIRRVHCYGYAWRVRAIIENKPQPWSETRSYDVEPKR